VCNPDPFSTQLGRIWAKTRHIGRDFPHLGCWDLHNKELSVEECCQPGVKTDARHETRPTPRCGINNTQASGCLPPGSSADTLLSTEVSPFDFLIRLGTPSMASRVYPGVGIGRRKSRTAAFAGGTKDRLRRAARTSAAARTTRLRAGFASLFGGVGRGGDRGGRRVARDRGSSGLTMDHRAECTRR